MTPIERMVDEACGVRQPAGKIRSNNIDEAGRRLANVGDAAKEWWESKRPLTWTQASHYRNPTVNCTTPIEIALAESVAKLVELGW